MSQFGKIFGVVNQNLVVITRRQPDVFTARGELHVQDGLAGRHLLYYLAAQGIDDIDLAVVREGEINPDLPTIRPRHGEYRLTANGDVACFFPGCRVDHQYLVVTDRGQV